MDAYEWFTKRESLALIYNVQPKDVPPEVVWYLADDQTLSQAEIRRAQEIWKDLQDTPRCAHCGGEALGFAKHNNARLCHHETRDCYHDVTVWGEILGQPGVRSDH